MTTTILVIEDNAVTRKLIRFTLEQEGYEVLEAGTGKLALELLETRRPDLVLQDLILPDIDGFELAATLRARLSNPRVPLLAFTGFVSNLSEPRISAAGFDDVLVKPIEPSRLKQIIQVHLAARVAPQIDTFGAGKLLVVADDDPLQLKLAAFRLGLMGFEVVTAPDGLAAIERAHERTPVAIVADIMMPRMDGFRLCLEARRDPRLCGLPVVLMTSGYVDEADRVLAREAGATACVLRTPDFQQVAEALREALRGPGTPAPVSGVEFSQLDREHSQRMIHRLERQVTLNQDLAQRCALLATELSILTGISSGLARGEDLDASLDEVLAASFDAAGISTGALLLFEPASVRVRAIGVADQWKGEDLGAFFGDLEELRAMLQEGRLVSLPVEGSRLLRAQRAMQSSGIPSAIVVPVSHRAELLGGLFVSSGDTASPDLLSFVMAVAGQLAQAVALARAFTARSAAEVEAKKNAATMRAMMESIADGIVVADAKGKVLFSNSAAEAVTRLKSGEVAPADWAENWGFFLPDRVTPFPSDQFPLTRAMRGETAERVEAFVRNAQLPEGALLSVNARPLIDDGSLSGGVTVFRDVTSERLATEQLLVSDRMASVGTLAAGVAHEINNPLAAVVANLEFAFIAVRDLEVEHGASPRLTELQEVLGEGREAAERVRLIVRDLKIFSRAEEDHRGPVDVRRVMESTLRMAGNEIRHRARLVTSYADVPPVEANESRLGQVFLNLVVNAAQAIPAGRSDRNEIRIQTTLDAGGRVVIEIRDTGSGMSPATLEKLFTPFFTTKPVGVGTGLGLAICQKLITNIGGEITVESQVGVGSTFKLFLRTTDIAADEPVVPALTKAARRRGRVLVVDDEPMIGSVVRRILGAEHDVQFFTRAQDALDCLGGGGRFDVILCDMMMPVVTGMDFYGRVAREFGEQAERIVFLTGGAFTVDARQFLDRVPNARLEKPFEPQNLRAFVNERVR